MAAPACPRPALLCGPLPEIRTTLASHWARLSSRSRRLRFLGTPDESFFPRFAARLEPLFVIGVRIDVKVRGVYEAHVLPNDHAEIAISIEDAWQGLGYGRQLFEAGLDKAAEAGVKTVDLFFSKENQSIAHLAYSLGAEIRTSYNECEAYIRLEGKRAKRS